MNLDLLRKDFPILAQARNGHTLVYLDNAATTQKPRSVLEAEHAFYATTNANVHRGVYSLAREATELYLRTHHTVARFIHASSYREVIFTRNTTEALNLLARSLSEKYLRPGDHVVASVSDHHSNLIPWILLKERMGIHLHLLPVCEDGTLDFEALQRELERKPRIVALPHVSNVLGRINDIRTIAELVHRAGALLIVDGAQAVPHLDVNVVSLGADAYAFSAHKMLGPLGMGVLWAREELLRTMPPFLGGGDMISEVRFSPESDQLDVVWNELPWKFEAGTANVASAVGMETAIQYLKKVGWSFIREHGYVLFDRLTRGLDQLPGVRTLIPVPDPEDSIGTLAFTLDGYSADDVASYLDTQGICVRSGRHCAHPLHSHFNVPATIRITPYIYNTEEEVDRCLEALETLTKA